MIKVKFIGKIFRSIPHFKGKYKLARLLLGKDLYQVTNITILSKSSLIFCLPNLIDSAYFELFIDGYYEKENIKFLVEKLKNKEVFIDIGANIGIISLGISQLLPNLKIISIEAAPSLAAILRQNVKNNNMKNITIVEKAIYNIPNIKLEFFSPTGKSGCGSLSPVFTNAPTIVTSNTIDGIIEEYKVNIEQLGPIKIDIEGFEVSAFQGASELNKTLQTSYFFEFVDWAESSAGFSIGEAQEFLINSGFSLEVKDSNKMNTLTTPMRNGHGMIYASKSQDL